VRLVVGTLSDLSVGWLIHCVMLVPPAAPRRERSQEDCLDPPALMMSQPSHNGRAVSK
jgi:hypothetical protein